VEISLRKKKLYLLYNVDNRHHNVITNIGGDTLAERYGQKMARLQRITSAGYTVQVGEMLWIYC
jgi:hypothetical protein